MSERVDRSELVAGRWYVVLQGSPSFGSHPVVVSIELHCRQGYTEGDVDNYNKGLLDACTHAGVWDDDSQVVDIRDSRRGSVKGGGAIVLVRPATEAEIEHSRTVDPDIDKLRDWGLT